MYCKDLIMKCLLGERWICQFCSRKPFYPPIHFYHTGHTIFRRKNEVFSMNQQNDATIQIEVNVFGEFLSEFSEKLTNPL